MNRSIFIDKIIEPVLFGNQILEYLFEENDKIELTLYSKLELVDKKFLKPYYRISFIRKFIFKNYNFFLDLNGYKNIESKIEKYFKQDWGIIINENQKGFFSFNMNVFYIDFTDEKDKENKIQFFVALIKSGIIDKYEIVEDDYVDPYYQYKNSKSITK